MMYYRGACAVNCQIGLYKASLALQLTYSHSLTIPATTHKNGHVESRIVLRGESEFSLSGPVNWLPKLDHDDVLSEARSWLIATFDYRKPIFGNENSCWAFDPIDFLYILDLL